MPRHVVIEDFDHYERGMAGYRIRWLGILIIIFSALFLGPNIVMTLATGEITKYTVAGIGLFIVGLVIAFMHVFTKR